MTAVSTVGLLAIVFGSGLAAGGRVGTWRYGENPKVVSERMGHAAVSITLDVHQHVNAAMQRDTADRVASIILGDS